jgi:hypothetical protein
MGLGTFDRTVKFPNLLVISVTNIKNREIAIRDVSTKILFMKSGLHGQGHSVWGT